MSVRVGYLLAEAEYVVQGWTVNLVAPLNPILREYGKWSLQTVSRVSSRGVVSGLKRGKSRTAYANHAAELADVQMEKQGWRRA